MVASRKMRWCVMPWAVLHPGPVKQDFVAVGDILRFFRLHKTTKRFESSQIK